MQELFLETAQASRPAKKRRFSQKALDMLTEITVDECAALGASNYMELAPARPHSAIPYGADVADR